MTGTRQEQGEQARSAVPLRGTQSLVGVFVQVWRRPALVALEVFWRWATAVPLGLLLWRALRPGLRRVRLDGAALEAVTVFQPAAAAKALEQAAAAIVPTLWDVARWWVPLALVLWTAVGATGKVAIWRRQDARLQARRAVVTAWGVVRSLGLLGAYLLWGGALWAAWRAEVLRPLALGVEPNLVLFAALGVVATLLLFVGWSLVAWVPDAARLLAMRHDTGLATSLRAAWRAQALRAKLIELNLVMGIVRVALLVLATVASATPLPFESVAGPRFLAVWWCLVAVVYLVVSDLFQVVRRAAGLSFVRALAIAEPRA